MLSESQISSKDFLTLGTGQLNEALFLDQAELVGHVMAVKLSRIPDRLEAELRNVDCVRKDLGTGIKNVFVATATEGSAN